MTNQLNEKVHEQATKLGFDLCGIAPAVTPGSLSHFQDWLDADYAGQMHYIANREHAYQHPRFVLPAVRSVIMTATCYAPTVPEESSVVGRIAKYAQTASDYHDVVRKMLKQLADFLHEVSPGCVTRAVVDTAPLLERDFARKAGLGWFGKNTMLINKQKGSNFFLGAILTDIELQPDAPFEASHCGTCTRCLDVCPSDAFVKEYVLDARRCISYHTIEQRNSQIPIEMRPAIQDWIFGCDLCQEVCPWTRHAPSGHQSELQPQENLSVSAVDFLEMNDDEFRSQYKKTSLWRTGRIALARNAAIVLGNSGDPKYLEVLIQQMHNENPLIQGAVVWAMGQLGDQATSDKLQKLAQNVTDDEILNEITCARQAIEKNNGE